MENKTTIIIVVAIIAVFAAIIGIPIAMNGGKKTTVDYSKYDLNRVIGPNEDDGEIGDHVKGNENAQVMMVEYADFQCSGCASVRTYVDKLIDKYEGKLGVIFRYYILSYHQNGTAAASAAEAAGLQGYWREYGDLLFKNQNEWAGVNVSQRTELFTSYFKTVAGDEGNSDQFLSDLASERVAKRVAFDNDMAENVIDVQATPAFYIDGEFLDWSGAGANTEEKFINFFSEKIDAKLGS